MNCKEQHIDWIDGAKGMAIISVFVMHALGMQCLHNIGWIFHMGQAVPVFLYVTAYLTSMHYKSFLEYYTWSRVRKVLWRVLVPFLVVQVVILLLFVLSGGWWSWKSLVKNGGFGPGSYYAWLYVQVWLLLPFIVELVRHLSVKLSFLVMLAISIVVEYVFVLLAGVEHIDSIYALTPIRYLMILYVGCVWGRLSDKSKRLFYIIAIISGVLMLLNVYNADNQLFSITPPIGENIIGILCCMYCVPLHYCKKHLTPSLCIWLENIVGNCFYYK